MESLSHHIVNNETSLNRNLRIIESLLDSGHSVELPSTGYSMFPSLRPGDIVIVNPIKSGDLSESGNIVVFKTNNGLVMHRLVEITSDNSGEQMLITRGDCMKENDKPLQFSQITGVAVKYIRSGKDHALRVSKPGRCRYNYNRKLLWFYNNLKRAGLFSF